MWTASSGSVARMFAVSAWWIVGCRAPAPVEPTGPPPSRPVESPGPRLVPPILGGSDAVRQQVIRFFAPIIYQDIEDGSAQDLFTRITFDGNWRGNDNWEHTFLYPKPGIVYTSLVEDANRYFLHYGLWWPRDWCSVTCGAWQDMHENDMEGLSLVIDKRFVTASWPFGQIISMDTRSHNGLNRYRNCQVEGGFPVYVTLRNAPAPPCIPFTGSYGGAVTPTAPRRAAVFVQAQTHAVRGYEGGDYPFAGGDGVIYYPTNGPAQVPGSTSTMTLAGYNLQWIDSTEVNAWSLWSQRRNATLTPDNILFEHDGSLVGPHDVYYQKHFACDGDCPLIGTRAKAPWGIASGSGKVGDWHNHPAFAWSQVYGPTGGFSPWYEYSCFSQSCRTQNTYRHNVFWSDAPFLSGGGTGGGGGSSCTGCPKTTAEQVRQGRGAEHRWDFENEAGFQVKGAAGSALVELPDQDWGYSSGRVTALRIDGSGRVIIAFNHQIDPSRIDLAVVRVRRVGGRPATFQANWFDESGERPSPAPRVLSQHRISEQGWEIVTLDLNGIADWKRLRTVNRFELQLDFGSASGAVELDFVILAP